MSTKQTITIAHGDGIGPEIMKATLSVLDAAGAPLEYEEIEVGEKVYLKGITAGIEDSAWESLLRNKVFLKAPITTPQGSGYKSLNVTTRKTLGLFSNVRPCVSYHPFVKTNHPVMDVVIVRENEEDLYAGIEHRQTRQVAQSLKIITMPGSEKIIRYAFEYTKAHGRKKLTCMIKDNIMKITDGAFHSIFKTLAKEYPEIQAESYIVDIGAARLADSPERFDVIVTLNLYGDILSDIAAEVSGSVGFAPSANIGDRAAMFEAIHGSAPDIAGKDIANPSALLLSAVMMLEHLGLGTYAATIKNAWLRTLEDGIHTADIFTQGTSKEKVGTQAFALAVIERLGQKPQTLPVYAAEATPIPVLKPSLPLPKEKTLYGSDVFVDTVCESLDELNAFAERVKDALPAHISLQMISNRGLKVWPVAAATPDFFVDHWRCRMIGENLTTTDLAQILVQFAEAGIEVIKTENLYLFDGVPGFSLAQGQ